MIWWKAYHLPPHTHLLKLRLVSRHLGMSPRKFGLKELRPLRRRSRSAAAGGDGSASEQQQLDHRVLRLGRVVGRVQELVGHPERAGPVRPTR